VSTNVVPMSSTGRTESDEEALLARAKAGDEGAFADLVTSHREELRAYCYRMLGSVHDAEDALQDALLRAWRNLPGFEGRSSVRTWLYAIATNTALDIGKRKSRRELPVSFGPAAGRGDDLAAPLEDALWLEPFPTSWLPGGASAPESRYEQRESVELAFMIALQRLPALQRAVLILREVMGFSAVEVAGQLDTSVAAVNSALQRARATAREGMQGPSQRATLATLGSRRTRALAQQFADAIERGDADTLLSMLTDDVTWSMPPIPTWFAGKVAVRDWLVRDPLTARWRRRPAEANGQLAVAGYLFSTDQGQYVPCVIDVLTLREDKIAAVTAFLTTDVQERPGGSTAPSGAEVFARFGLPAAPD